MEYIRLYKERGCREHYEVNDIITAEMRWDEFRAMRSWNRHQSGVVIRGIRKRYFWMVCELLRITDAGGSPLEEDMPY